MRSRFAACSACASCAPSGRGRTDALRASKKEAMRGRSDGGEIAPYRQRPCGLLSRRAKPITARATGLRLWRIFPKAEKPPIATLSLMQFALSAVMFGSRRDEGRPCPRFARFRPRLRRVEQRAGQGKGTRRLKDSLDTFAPDDIEQGKRGAARMLRASFQLGDIANREVKICRKDGLNSYSPAHAKPEFPHLSEGQASPLRLD